MLGVTKSLGGKRTARAINLLTQSYMSLCSCFHHLLKEHDRLYVKDGYSHREVRHGFIWQLSVTIYGREGGAGKERGALSLKPGKHSSFWRLTSTLFIVGGLLYQKKWI